MSRGWIGRRVARKEDHRFLTGRGRFTDDLAGPRCRVGADGALTVSACADPRCRCLGGQCDGRRTRRAHRTRRGGEVGSGADPGSNRTVRAAEPRRLADARSMPTGPRIGQGAVHGRAGGRHRRRDRGDSAERSRGGRRRVRAAAGGDHLRAGARSEHAGVGRHPRQRHPRSGARRPRGDRRRVRGRRACGGSDPHEQPRHPGVPGAPFRHRKLRRRE